MLHETNHPCSNPSPRSTGMRRRGVTAFTLLEITLALSIAAGSMVMMVGLLSTGLDHFRETTTVTISAQIAQRLVQEAVQTDYDTLTGGVTTTGPINKGWRYFDIEGLEETSSNSPAVIFHVLTRIVPASSMPRSTALSTSHSMATVTVQVAANPGKKTIPVRGISESDPLSSTIEPNSGIPFRSYTGHIAKVR